MVLWASNIMCGHENNFSISIAENVGGAFDAIRPGTTQLKGHHHVPTPTVAGHFLINNKSSEKGQFMNVCLDVLHGLGTRCTSYMYVYIHLYQ